MSYANLDERALLLLKALVERYIREGQPVGSKTLAEDMNLPLSPATIRNVLADLEAQGFLRSPHTSAGRVPTVKGYRLFVDSLITVKALSKQEVNKVKKQLDPELNTASLVASASSLLSNITHLAGIVTVPKQKQLLLRHVEFVALSSNRILIVLVLNDREVQNRIITTNRSYSDSELQEAANYLNSNFAGTELNSIRRKLRNKMEQDKLSIDQLMQAVIDIPATTNEDFVMSGQAHLLHATDVNDVNCLRELFEAFTQKRDIIYLLDQCLKTEGVQLYIGEESGYEPLDSYSLVTSPYSLSDQVVGVLAVIGPTRMAYDRVIPIVDITAKLLSAALNQSE